MAITIEAGVLSRAMKSAAAIVEGSNTIPILANVRIEAAGDQLEIVTSNLDIEYRQRLPLTGAGDLATTVDARRLAAIAASSEQGAQLTFEANGHALIVKSGRSRWQLPMLPVQNYPAMPFESQPVEVEMPGKDLAIAIARTAWSVETNTTRYYLCGIFLDHEDGKLRFTTTNGHTLVCLTSDVAWPAGAAPAIIATKFARTLERMAAEASVVTFGWDDRKFRATAGSITLTGKLVDGNFPDYRRVIPTAGNRPITVEPEPLRKALRRMDLIASEKTRSVKATFGQGMIGLQVTDVSHGVATEEVPADCIAGHETGFNSAYLSQMLEAIGGDTIEMHHQNPGAPCLFQRSVRDGLVGVVMPMRV